MWKMGGAGPMFGQFGFSFKFVDAEIEDKRPLQRYIYEPKRLLGVLSNSKANAISLTSNTPLQISHCSPRLTA